MPLLLHALRRAIDAFAAAATAAPPPYAAALDATMPAFSRCHIIADMPRLRHC